MQYNAFLLDIEKYDFVKSNTLKEMLSNSIKITLFFYMINRIYVLFIYFQRFLGIEYI